jgi:hypothetical protein
MHAFMYIYIYKDSWKRAFFDQLCKTYFVNKYEQTLKENKNGPPRSRIFCVDPHPLNTPKGNSAKPKVTLGQGITGHLSVRPNPRQLRTPPFFESTFPVLILLLLFIPSPPGLRRFLRMLKLGQRFSETGEVLASEIS